MSPEEYDKKLIILKDEFKQIVFNAPFFASNDLQGKILIRVFSDGKDSQGASIGQYKPGPYKAKRNAKGRRIDTVDLQFTGALMESIKNGYGDEGTAVIGFNNLSESKIGRYNEERYKKPIFAPTKNEQDDSKVMMNDYIKDELRQRIRNIFSA